jgi:hypothetical protein
MWLPRRSQNAGIKSHVHEDIGKHVGYPHGGGGQYPIPGCWGGRICRWRGKFLETLYE